MAVVSCQLSIPKKRFRYRTKDPLKQGSLSGATALGCFAEEAAQVKHNAEGEDDGHSHECDLEAQVHGIRGFGSFAGRKARA